MWDQITFQEAFYLSNKKYMVVVLCFVADKKEQDEMTKLIHYDLRYQTYETINFLVSNNDFVLHAFKKFFPDETVEFPSVVVMYRYSIIKLKI